MEYVERVPENVVQKAQENVVLKERENVLGSFELATASTMTLMLVISHMVLETRDVSLSIYPTLE